MEKRAISQAAIVSPFLARFFATAALLLGAMCLPADQISMRNGDRYVGRVVSLNADALVLESEVLGRVQLTRQQVAQITFERAPSDEAAAAEPAKPSPQLPPANGAVAAPGVNAFAQQLGTNSSLIRQVQTEWLSGASPAAQNKFNELVTGLQTGKLSVGDIRAEAQTAAQQLRAARQDLGEEAGWLIDGYLGILDGFLNQTKSAATPSSRPADPAGESKRSVVAEEEE
jgi:hypothetical protein